MNPQERALAIRAALADGPSAGEKQLTLLGQNNDDIVLAEIVRELDPHTIAALAGEADTTKPSLASDFCTPEQFIGALEAYGARWPTLDRSGSLEVRTHQEDLELFILQFVVRDNNEHNHLANLEAFADHELALEILLFLGLDRYRFEEAVVSPEDSGARGTYHDLYAAIKEHHPDVWAAFKERCKQLGPDVRDHIALAITISNQLAALGAATQTAAETSDRQPEGDFLDI